MVAHDTRRARRPVRLTPVITVLVVALCTACGSGSSGSPAPTTTASTPATTPSHNPAATGPGSQDPKAAAASRTAVTAYQGYIQAFAAAAQIPDPEYPALSRYATDPLLSLTRHNVRVLKNKGEVQLGAQTATVSSTSVDLAHKPPVVTIHACLDYSALRLVYQADHSPVPNSQITTTKLSAITTVWQYLNGEWLVNETKTGTDPC